MEELNHFIANFKDYLLLILVCMLFFKEVLSKYLEKLLGINLETEEQTPLWAQNLQTYFNHDTTEFHITTHQKLDQLILMETKEHEQAQDTRDTMREIAWSVKEIREKGVNCN